MPPTNPIFNDNTLKLGTFCTNGAGGALTLAPEAPALSWDTSVRAARLADRAGYEAIVPFARWKGFDGTDPARPSGVVMDPYTWAAGIAQATRHSGIFATSHGPTVHPVVAAKAAATIDLISGGRFALNLVAGWNRPELDMFGQVFRDHSGRYDYLEEWWEVVRRLWSEAEPFDHHGTHFDVTGGVSYPKPVQRPGPPLMNAGGSDRGARFACQHADMCFVALGRDEPDHIRSMVQRYKTLARDSFDRDIQVWTNTTVVQRDTQAEADAYLHRYAVEYEDTRSVDGKLDELGQNSRTMPVEVLRAIRMRFAAGSGGTLLVGTASSIAERLELLSDCGIDGVLLTWLDYTEGLEAFNGEVLPLLEKSGLRDPFAAPEA